MGSLPVYDGRTESRKATAGDTQMTVHNIRPVFQSEEAQEKVKKEIAHILYRIFSKYD